MPTIQFLVSCQNTTELHQLDVESIEELNNELKLAYGYEYFSLVYFDDEGDFIKLTCKPEFDEAINYAKSNGDFLSIILEPTNPSIIQIEEPKEEQRPSVEEPKIPNPVQSLFDLLQGTDVVNNIVESSEKFLSGQNLQQIFGVKEEKEQEVPVAQEEEKEPEPEVIAPEEPAKVVHHAICDNCNQTIVGVRYKCIQCPDFDFCEVCEGPDSGHDESHVFAKLYTREQRIPQKKGKCGRRGGFGPRKRISKLEQDVTSLQEQVAALLAKKQQEELQQQVPEPVVEQPQEEEELVFEDLSVRIEDVNEEEEEEVEVCPAVPEQEQSQAQNTEQILDYLAAMGFTDRETNLRYIIAFDGNVDAILGSLLDGDF